MIVSPRQYLEKAERVNRDKGRWVLPERNEISRLIGDGGVFVGGEKWRNLPHALIRGGLEISHCPRLESLDLVVMGGATVGDCPALSSLRGEYFVDLGIGRCGVEKLWADLSVYRNLSVSECFKLDMINSTCGGRFSTRICPALTHTGAAFSVKNSATFETCEKLSHLRGAVGEITLGYDIGSVDSDWLVVAGGERGGALSRGSDGWRVSQSSKVTQHQI